jgi:hypothetical protein
MYDVTINNLILKTGYWVKMEAVYKTCAPRRKLLKGEDKYDKISHK